jgi:hypothetical protein
MSDETSLCGGPTGSLDERDPIAAVRATDLPHYKMIAWIHCADLDFLVGKDSDDPIPDVDNHLLVDFSPLGREMLERPKKRLAAPGCGVAWIDMNRDQFAIRFHPEDELASARTPLLAQTWRHHPCAIKIAALGGAGVIDRASAVAGRTMGAPCSGRLGERINLNKLAAKRPGTIELPSALPVAIGYLFLTRTCRTINWSERTIGRFRRAGKAQLCAD